MLTDDPGWHDRGDGQCRSYGCRVCHRRHASDRLVWTDVLHWCRERVGPAEWHRWSGQREAGSGGRGSRLGRELTDWVWGPRRSLCRGYTRHNGLAVDHDYDCLFAAGRCVARTSRRSAQVNSRPLSCCRPYGRPCSSMYVPLSGRSGIGTFRIYSEGPLWSEKWTFSWTGTETDSDPKRSFQGPASPVNVHGGGGDFGVAGVAIGACG